MEYLDEVGVVVLDSEAFVVVEVGDALSLELLDVLLVLVLDQLDILLSVLLLGQSLNLAH